MHPEQKVRQKIDCQLKQAGWIVQDYREMNISAGLGVAVRALSLKIGAADYMLYAAAEVIGVVEAKAKGQTLTAIETQSGKYLDGIRRAAAPSAPSAVRPRRADLNEFQQFVSSNRRRLRTLR